MTIRRARRRGGRPPVALGGTFALGIAVIALHVVDDSFLQPQPGTSAGDHLVSGLAPLAVLAVAAWAHPRLRGGRRGALELLCGAFGLVAGSEAIAYTSRVGPSGDDYTGLLALAAGLLLLTLGAVTLWRTRRLDGRRPRRYARRALLGIAGFVAAMFFVFPVGLAYVSSHVARAVVPPENLGVAYEKVAFTTNDGLELAGWYIPSQNRAAVIAFPGRRGPQRQARMLAQHGYGVLLFDRRGEGRSQGEPNAFGWGGTRDIEAAIAFLQRRPDVDPGRIGGIGLSVGGEMMLEEAAGNEDLAAVVSEGAGARVVSEELDDLSGAAKYVSAPMLLTKTAALAVFSDQAPPTNLAKLIPRIAPRPVFIINAAHGEVDRKFAEYVAAAREPKRSWLVPHGGHTGAIDAMPQEYERRVIGFFDRALRP